MTKLTKPVRRETPFKERNKPIIITIEPAGPGRNEALIHLHEKGRRFRYTVALSKLYIMAALWHGEAMGRERIRERKARLL